MVKADVIIIGAGVTGCAVARELARTRRSIIVLEKASDVCEGTSKANSGIVHAGHDALPGTLKALLGVLGSRKMEALSKELDFPYKRNGSLVLCFERGQLPALKELKKRGEENGVPGLELLTPGQVWEREPNVSEDIVGALYAPSGAIVCPFGLTIALAENACENGVEFYLNHGVDAMERTPGGRYRVRAAGEEFDAPVVVNAAGVYADVIHNMVSGRKMEIVPRRGEYCLLDKEQGGLVSSTVFQLPSRMGKGILVTPTVHGNLLVGPTAEEIPDREGVNTTRDGLEKALALGSRSVRGISAGRVITSFAGLRAHVAGLQGKAAGDFLIGEAEDAPGFFDAAGIESPGLTGAPAIGEYVAGLINSRFPAPFRVNFQGRRKGLPSMAAADEGTREELIRLDPSYASVVCRCELVTEGEIRNAIRRPLGAVTLDGIKRRTRAGMGRCQSGFCSPRAAQILAEELGLDLGEVTKAGGASLLLTGRNKERRQPGEAAAGGRETRK